MSAKLKMQIETLDIQIKKAELYAQWWIARAVTGETKSRLICHGDGTTLSDEDKVKDALNIAHNHIRSLCELSDKKIELLNDLYLGG